MEAASEKNEKSDENIDWNVDTEVQLFHAMKGHKPVGVNRYFQMACIHQKFSSSINKDIHSQIIWDHLDTMYDMAALHESEILPFPNVERDFTLPDTDFRELLCERAGNRPIETVPSSDDEQQRTSSKPSEAPKRGDTDPSKSAGKTPRQEQSSRKETPQRSTSGKEPPQRSTGGKVRPEHAHGKVRTDSTPTNKAKPEVKPKSEPQKAEKKTTETKGEAKDSRSSTPKAEGGGTPKRTEQTHSTKEKVSRKSETSRSGSRGQDDTPSDKGKSGSSGGGGSNRSSKEEADSSAKRGAAKRRQDPGSNKPPSPQVTAHSKRRR